MTIDVIVYRGDGSKIAPDLIEKLATTHGVAREIGRNFLDANSGLQSVELSVVYDAVYVPGMIVEVSDSAQGVMWYGEIDEVTHSLSIDDFSLGLETALRINRRP